MNRALAAVFFGSGCCALINEVLWPRAFGVALGGSHRAEALVLGVLFAALALGAAIGAQLAGVASPRLLWRRYATCEGLTGLTSLGPVLLAPILATTPLEGPQGALTVAVLACLVPPVAAIGATWPLMLALTRSRGGAVGSLYAVTTGGAVVGALSASFVLAELLGTRGGLLLSALGSLVLCAIAIRFARRTTDTFECDPESETADPQTEDDSPGDRAVPTSALPVWIAGALSGLLVLGFEVLNARLLALRLPHTVYSFGTVLAVQLLGMSLGGLIARRLVDRGLRALGRLLLCASMAAAWAPLVATASDPPDPASTWLGSLISACLEAVLLLGPGALLLGAVFPLASALLSRTPGPTAPMLGRLAALNAVAGLLGAVGTGLVLVPWVGLGGGYVWLATLCCALGVLCGLGRAGTGRFAELAVACLALLAAVGAARFSPTPPEPGERLLAQVEGPAATAAVLEDESGHRRLVVNRRYTLGDSVSRTVSRRLALLPALLRPAPKRTLVIGLATGITSGAAQEVAGAAGGSVEVAELLPEVVQLAPLFEEWQGRSGPEPILHVADGRRVLLDAKQPFDLIVFDLFLPWRPGTAFLYTQETFSLVKERLTEHGACALWLPLYQLSPESLLLILETFGSVFPEARLYAASLEPGRQVVAVVSRAAPAHEVEEARRLLTRAKVLDDPLLTTPGMVGAFELGEVKRLLPKIASALEAKRGGIQRDDRPWVEFDGPRARARGRVIGAARFRILVEAANATREGAERLTGADFAVRAVWNPLRAQRLLSRALASPQAHPITGRMAWRLSQEASQRGDELQAGELAAIAAHASVGQQRMTAASFAVHALARAGANDRGDAVLRELLGSSGLLGPGVAPLALEGAQLALAAKNPQRAVAWLARIENAEGGLAIARLVVLAMAADQGGDRDAAKRAIGKALAADRTTTWATLEQGGATAWAEALSGQKAPP